MLVCVSAKASAQAVYPKTLPIKWKNLEPIYKNFREIRPMLVNEGNQSLFLSRLWPDGSAQLERYDEDRRTWELGEWSGSCAAVKDATAPIEIKSKSERAIDVHWQLSADDWDHPKHFLVHETLQERPLRGKYRLVLRCALTPWTLGQHPAQIYLLQSPEFILEQ